MSTNEIDPIEQLTQQLLALSQGQAAIGDACRDRAGVGRPTLREHEAKALSESRDLQAQALDLLVVAILDEVDQVADPAARRLIRACACVLAGQSHVRTVDAVLALVTPIPEDN
jgi:hypothetical protein